MSQPSTYTGSCHCGAVRYTVEVDLSQPVMSCNCSMCGRAGTLLTFAPMSKFKLEQGSESLTDYQFNKHAIHHVFCKVCGIKSFARGTARDGSEMAAINVRCLEGVDPSKLTIKQVDGKSL
ncbi:MAG TPA: GFA family protein [Kofleriaceae bacterium]|nr:GFA family protein [Kofleriaceae bacterium]